MVAGHQTDTRTEVDVWWIAARMGAMTDSANSRMNLKISVDLDEHLTWAELLRFVDLARPTVDLTKTVGIEYDQNSMEPRALYAYLPDDLLKSVTDD